MKFTHTKEFHELREQFEKDMKQSSIYISNLDRIEKDEKNPAGVFYNNGTTNNLFQMYMMGYQNAKCIHRLE